MKRFTVSFLLFAAFLFGTQCAVATTLFVGSCKTASYPTISAAVAAAPSGATVEVCAGIYPEQVVISTS